MPILLSSQHVVKTLALALVLISSAQADDWPRFRGPDLDGISKESGWKSEGEAKIAWQTRVGLGHAGFVVSEGRAITTGHDGKDAGTVYCFDAITGKEIWKHSYPHPLDDLYYPGGTTATPTFDGDVVYHLARRGQLFCLEAATGKVKWSKDLMIDLEYDRPTWGFAGSPLVDGDRLLLNVGDAGLALNKHDGSVIWQSKNGEAGYSTPYPIIRGGRDLAIVSNKRSYACIDRATGEEMWNVKWLTRYGVNASSPIVIGDLLFIGTGYGKGSTLMKFPDDKATSTPKQIWKSRDFGTQMNAGILIDGYLYGIHGNSGHDGSGLKCIHFESGESQWTDTSFAHGAVLAADGKLIALSETGELAIGPVSPAGFKPTLKQQILGEKCWTVPTLANGLLYCRNDKGDVVVLDLRK